jgi:TRAP-type uncharacterized transport system fused permease subunit
MYFGMLSMVTPPVAFAAFAAANIAKADFWQTGWTAVKVGWSAYIVPFLFALSPQLILRGDPFEVMISTVTAFLGVYMGTVAVVGYLNAPVPIGYRAVYAIAGLMLLAPVDLFTGAGWVNVAGILVAAAGIAREFMRGRAAPRLAGNGKKAH